MTECLSLVGLIYTSQESDLRYSQVNAEVDVNVVLMMSIVLYVLDKKSIEDVTQTKASFKISI